MSKQSTEKNEKTESKIVKFFTNPTCLLIISLIIILIALGSPLLFTKVPSIVTFGSREANVGGTFGIMNPFVAIAAAIITFAAFLIQYKANQELLDSNEDIRTDNKKQQLANRFYEMLKIHRENVKELEWIQKVHYTKEVNPKDVKKSGQEKALEAYRQKFGVKGGDEKSTIESGEEFFKKNGRQIFFYYINEFNIIYNIIDILYPKLEIHEKTKRAYNIFYKGASDELFDGAIRSSIRNCIRNCKNDGRQFLVDVSAIVRGNPAFRGKEDKIISVLMDFIRMLDYFSLQLPFLGHFEKLNNYYRHLFLTVKTIAKEKSDILTYDEKRDLLRILRAQLTNTEQIMLFYNWFSGNGSQWEQIGHQGYHFFTEYRMIHNITPNRIIPFQSLDGDYKKAYENFINYFGKCPYIKIYGSKKDPMFEFEDWTDHPKFEYDK